MKIIRINILAGFIIILSISNAVSEILEKGLSITEIRSDLFIINHTYPWPSNSLLAVMGNGDILLVDTPYTPKAMEMVLSWIQIKFGKRNIKAINTHFHIDRLGGNEALVKVNIPIFSSELTINAIKTRGQNSLNLVASWLTDDLMKEYYHHFKYILPTNIFSSKKGLTLNFGDEVVAIKYLGVGHSKDNLVVYLTKKKVIFGGCMIFSLEATKAGNVSDGNINEWKKTLDLIDTKNYDLVIPGHGKIGGLELIKHTKEILENY